MSSATKALYDFFQKKLDIGISENPSKCPVDDPEFSKPYHGLLSCPSTPSPAGKKMVTISKTFPIAAESRSFVNRENLVGLIQTEKDEARQRNSKRAMLPKPSNLGHLGKDCPKFKSETNLRLRKDHDLRKTFVRFSGRQNGESLKTDTRLSNHVLLSEMNFGEIELSQRISINPIGNDLSNDLSNDKEENEASGKRNSKVANFFRKIYKKMKKVKWVKEEFPPYEFDTNAMTNADPSSQTALTLEHLVVQTPYGFSTLKSRPMTMCTESMFH